MYDEHSIGIVVPAFNEDRYIQTVIDNIPAFVDRIYVVNDGSTDATLKTVTSLNGKHERLTLINHSVNRGVGAAIITGYKKCLEDGVDVVVVMAGDDQMDPVQLSTLLAPIIKGTAGYSKGNRMSSWKHMKGMSLWRRFGNWLLKWLTRISSGNYQLSDPQNGYTAVSLKALRQIDIDDVYDRYGYCNELLTRFSVAGIKVAEVPMPARYQGEKSQINYLTYIPRVSWLLLRNFVWRMKMKFIFRS